MQTLKIVIKGQFFDEIKSGVKKIEYREVTPFWTSRLYTKEGKKRTYEKIEFINGYNTDARRMITEYGGVSKKGNLYHINIGRILKENNQKPGTSNKDSEKKKERKSGLSSDFYIQYHNADVKGRFPFTRRKSLTPEEPDKQYTGPFAFYTLKPSVLNAVGGNCFVIVGVGGKDKRYYLWTMMRIDKIKDSGEFIASGPGFNLNKAVLLNDKTDFADFKRFCGNFGIGFQKINNHPFYKKLLQLARKNMS